jgi:glycerol-3-phosphate acyltransferase PlsX
VGLLNIGEEAIKGSETIKRAGELLRAAGSAGHINFQGNVEGNDIYKGTVDIVVCDGFVGNVLLKTSEGLAVDAHRVHPPGVHAHAAGQAGGAGGDAGAQALQAPRRPAPLQRRGAAGLRGLVFKSHGSADAYAFEHALSRAYDAARNRLLDRVHDRIGPRWRRCPPRPHRPQAGESASDKRMNPNAHGANRARASPAPAATCRRGA